MKNISLVNFDSKLAPWIICVSAALFFFYLVLQLAVFNTIGASLMSDFGISSNMLGQLSATYLYTCSIFFLPAGLLFDRFSTKKLLIISGIICVIGTAMIALAHTIFLAFLGRILVGISNPFSFLGPMRLANKWFSKDKKAFVIGLMVTIGMSGGIVAQSPFAILMNFVGGWRPAMMINAIFGLVLIAIMIIFIKDKPNKVINLENDNENKNLHFVKGLKLAASKKQNWFCGIYTGLMNLPLPVLGALWGNLYLVQTKSYSTIAAGNLLSFIFIGLIFGPPIIGKLSDKLASRKIPMIFSAMGIFLSIIFIVYTHFHFVGLAILLFLLGFFSGAQAMSYPVVIESNPAAIESTSLGLISVLVNAIGAGAQVLFGWLMDLNWNHLIQKGAPFYSITDFNIALSILPLGFIICIAIALMLKETFPGKK